jgi:ATP/maltotriose-dependent transcriptional regulator MalT
MKVLVANYLNTLGRYDEALLQSPFYIESTLHEDVTSEIARLNIQSILVAQYAIGEAVHGNAEVAFADFDRAVECAKQIPDGHRATMIWDTYASWAIALGRIDIARSCREHALLVARERRILWRIPYFTLCFADLLLTSGDYDHACELVADAMTYDYETPVLRVLLGTVGVMLAQALNDTELLERVFDEEALEYAFRSHEPLRVAPIVAAYAKVHITRGNSRHAKALIARGIAAIDRADHAGDLLALAARYGSLADAGRAQELLVKRLALPHHRIAQAYFAMWETYDALRKRKYEDAKKVGKHAAHLFGTLGWNRQRDEVLAVAGLSQHAHAESLVYEDAMQRPAMLSDVSLVLTDRERQVAQLVLRGLTNRAVAKTLAISEHTVETHMTSILNRLGIRSRWQLRDLLVE